MDSHQQYLLCSSAKFFCMCQTAFSALYSAAILIVFLMLLWLYVTWNKSRAHVSMVDVMFSTVTSTIITVAALAVHALHEIWLALPVFLTSCNINLVYYDRKVSCSVTHFTSAFMYNNIATGNAINIHFSKAHLNQLRRVTEKTPCAVPGSWGSAPQAPLLAVKCSLGGIISVFCHWVLWLIPAPAGQQALPWFLPWFKTNYVMMILCRRLWVWCVVGRVEGTG